MLGEVFAGYLNALADGNNLRMSRAVILQQSLLFQQEWKKHSLFQVPGRILPDALATGLGESWIAQICLVQGNGAGLPKRDRFATLPDLNRFALELRWRRGDLSESRRCKTP